MKKNSTVQTVCISVSPRITRITAPSFQMCHRSQSWKQRVSLTNISCTHHNTCWLCPCLAAFRSVEQVSDQYGCFPDMGGWVPNWLYLCCQSADSLSEMLEPIINQWWNTEKAMWREYYKCALIHTERALLLLKSQYPEARRAKPVFSNVTVNQEWLDWFWESGFGPEIQRSGQMHNITGWMSYVIFVPLCKYLQSITLYIIFPYKACLVQAVPCLI